MNINESLGKKTIGLSSKLKIGCINDNISSTKNSTNIRGGQVSQLNSGQSNARIITNYVSKTAQASAYASKNHSNNSSVVRESN